MPLLHPSVCPFSQSHVFKAAVLTVSCGVQGCSDGLNSKAEGDLETRAKANTGDIWAAGTDTRKTEGQSYPSHFH